jgi:hypothetical protein
MQFISFRKEVFSMQSNTAVVRNQDANFANFSVESRKSDPFTTVDGRHIGHDGFVVPKNFDEFHERFPEYVRRWVERRVERSTPDEDVEDWTQDLLIHLRYLPAISKHRQAGKHDIVQTFDPVKHHGANAARFFSYINLCLGNKFRTMRSTRLKNPLCRPGNLSLTADWEDTDRDQVDDLFCHGHSEHLKRRRQREERQWDARHVLAEFSEFAKREDSTVLPAMVAIAATATSGDAAEVLGTTRAGFCRMRSRLRQLGTCFQNGEKVPRQRRPYKRRLTMRICFRVR